MAADISYRFGPTWRPDRTEFRLWAPAAKSVALVLGQEETLHDIPPGENGWYGLSIDDVAPGTPYAFRINGETNVPDPASRLQAEDVHGPSLVTVGDFQWKNDDWRGRPWAETVCYELHVGAATPEGTFDALRGKLDYFAALGVTAIELMPLADFPGSRNWGYDGVLPFAPDRSYGTPDELKRLIDEAHGKGLQVFIDVVYNHFGPDGNYLNLYADKFFTDAHDTPWGDAIDFSQDAVRRFFIENALYWLSEYRFDGIRFDAVHAIRDEASPHFLEELAEAVRETFPADRHIHLVLENDDNNASLLSGHDSRRYDAQWNDDIHHVLHRLVTGETDGYYADYEDRPHERLCRALAEGFVYQGEPSGHRGGTRRGQDTAGLPTTAFVTFLQNHDQVGNRAMGERVSDAAPAEAVIAASALYLLCPQVPMIWMGEEWAATSTFPFFCDFHGELAEAVREGRRREFAQFKKFADPKAREAIPDPNAAATFDAAKLDWDQHERLPHRERYHLFGDLLRLRHRHVVPLLKSGAAQIASQQAGSAIAVSYAFPAGRLVVVTNLAPEAAALPNFDLGGEVLYTTHPDAPDLRAHRAPAWYTAVILRQQ